MTAHRVRGSDLSPRELEVLEAILVGEAYKSVGHRLGIAEATVKVHVKAIFRHYGVGTRGELIALLAERKRIVLRDALVKIMGDCSTPREAAYDALRQAGELPA